MKEARFSEEQIMSGISLIRSDDRSAHAVLLVRPCTPLPHALSFVIFVYIALRLRSHAESPERMILDVHAVAKELTWKLEGSGAPGCSTADVVRHDQPTFRSVRGPNRLHRDTDMYRRVLQGWIVQRQT